MIYLHRRNIRRIAMRALFMILQTKQKIAICNPEWNTTHIFDDQMKVRIFCQMKCQSTNISIKIWLSSPHAWGHYSYSCTMIMWLWNKLNQKYLNAFLYIYWQQFSSLKGYSSESAVTKKLSNKYHRRDT